MFFEDSDWGAEPFVSQETKKKKDPEHVKFLGSLSEAEKDFVLELVAELPIDYVTTYSKAVGTKFHVSIFSDQQSAILWISWMLKKRRKETEELNKNYNLRKEDPECLPEFEEVMTDSGLVYWQMKKDNRL